MAEDEGLEPSLSGSKPLVLTITPTLYYVREAGLEPAQSDSQSEASNIKAILGYLF